MFLLPSPGGTGDPGKASAGSGLRSPTTLGPSGTWCTQPKVTDRKTPASPVRTVRKWYSLWPLIDGAQFGQQAEEAAILDLLQTEILADYFNNFKINKTDPVESSGLTVTTGWPTEALHWADFHPHSYDGLLWSSTWLSSHAGFFLSAFPLIWLHVDHIHTLNASDKGPDKNDLLYFSGCMQSCAVKGKLGLGLKKKKKKSEGRWFSHIHTSAWGN